MTVALVSLPLSISLAIAADATPVQGIITACWAGLISAITGGSHYNIVGPTGKFNNDSNSLWDFPLYFFLSFWYNEKTEES